MPKTGLNIVVKKTYAVDGLELLKAREAAGLSQQALADLMDGYAGWCQQDISYKESPGILHSVDADAVERLAELFPIHFTQPLC